MKYSDLISFNPIESIIQLTSANDLDEEAKLVKSYVMSDDMAEKISLNMLSQLKLEEVVDNKGVLLVGNYGTGKSHLMSLVSAVARNADYLPMVQNQRFALDAECIAGQFEVLRIEIGASQMSLRNIILNKVQQDFTARGLPFSFPDERDIINNKDVLLNMMEIFARKYGERGYLIVVDEFLDYLGGRKEQEVKLDLGFMRELGEIIKSSRLRAIFGVQEKLFDNPNFSFVSQTLNRVKDRFEQVVIRKEDTAYVVSERILKKTSDQKALIREHLQKFCSLYTNMSERMEEYVELFPIHPSYIDVFNKIYIIENRHILKNISEIIRRILNDPVTDEAPGIISFDTYWGFIKENLALKTDANIKEVVEKSGMLEDIINRSFPKRLYKSLAIKIIYALSVHRLTTGDISIRAGLTAENLRDDLCLYLVGMPDQSSDTLQSIVQVVLRDIMTTVSGQFIEHNTENGQYYLDLKKDIDYDEKITQRAAVIDDDKLNTYYNNIIYYCLDWDATEHVTNFRIYEHTLNWASHNIFRRGYLFLGTPESRPTAQPPEDYYIYFLPPYGSSSFHDEHKKDEVFFVFKPNEDFKNQLRLYAAALMMRELAEDKNKSAYAAKAEGFKKKLTRMLNENKITWFDVIYCGQKKMLKEVMKNQFKPANPFKETIELVASICLDEWFTEKYPRYPHFKTLITTRNEGENLRYAYDRFTGRKHQTADLLLESFDLLDGGKITVQNSRYAQVVIERMEGMPPKAVINFNDFYIERFDEFVDSVFQLDQGLFPIILLALVYTGNAVLTLKDGTALTASNLDIIPKKTMTDIQYFKYISKPKDIQLAELVHLYEILELPTGLITNPSQRESGLDQMLAKAKEVVQKAAKARSRLQNNFHLWGEPLVAEHISVSYYDSLSRVVDILGNFQTRFNSVPKLNNFAYTREDMDRLEADIRIVSVVMEYDEFRNGCGETVSYIMNLDRMDLGTGLKEEIETAKERFRQFRDDIPEDLDGAGAASDVNDDLEKIKEEYISIYYKEHNKRRLGISDGKRKGEIMSSRSLANLDRLSALNIFSGTKVKAIKDDLSALKICYDLEPVMLSKTHFCTKCNFLLGNHEPPVKGRLDDIESRIDNLLFDWTTTLLNTITDPFAQDQMQYLSVDQRCVVEDFVKTKKLPEKVDVFFVDAIKALLDGFEAVEISASEFVEQLENLGPCDVESFRSKIDSYINSYIMGKDKDKLRLVLKR